MNKQPAPNLSKLVAIELKNARNRGGWTWTEIEERTGIPHSTMQRMLSGEVDIPVSRLLLICEAAGIDPGALMDEAVRHMPAGYLEGMLKSPAADNVTQIPVTDWDEYQGRKAADNDVEAEADEPDPA